MYTKYDEKLELNSKWSPRMNFLFSVYKCYMLCIISSVLTIKMNWKKKCFCQKLEFKFPKDCEKIRNQESM